MRRKSSDKTQERQTTVHYIKWWVLIGTSLCGTSLCNKLQYYTFYTAFTTQEDTTRTGEGRECCTPAQILSNIIIFSSKASIWHSKNCNGGKPKFLRHESNQVCLFLSDIPNFLSLSTSQTLQITLWKLKRPNKFWPSALWWAIYVHIERDKFVNYKLPLQNWTLHIKCHTILPIHIHSEPLTLVRCAQHTVTHIYDNHEYDENKWI